MTTTSYKSRRDKESVNAPSEVYGLAEEGVDFPEGVARFLLVGTEGTATLVRPDGVEVANVPLRAGYNPLVCRQVKTLGTAADVYYCV
jgi:hypothetical protein